jgi:hypothetical protein
MPAPGGEDLRAELGAKAREALAGMLLRGSTPTPVHSPSEDRPREAVPWERSLSSDNESSKRATKKEKGKKEKKDKDKKHKKGKSTESTEEVAVPINPLSLRILPEIEETLRMGPRFSVGTLLQGFAEIQSVGELFCEGWRAEG